MASSPRRLRIGVTTDVVHGDGGDGRSDFKVGEKYVRAVLDCMDAVPLILPSFGADLAPDQLTEGLDGLLFTGAISNVHPARFGAEPSREAEPYDEIRDATTLPLLRHALETGLPTLCICRGFQELNVVQGGSLFPEVHNVSGRTDHRRPQSDDLDVQYGPNHDIRITPGSLLEQLVADARISDPVMINSLHLQGIDRLGSDLAVEAVAEDGTVEAMRYTGGPGWCYGVQWHPEYKAAQNPLSRALFSAFAAAVKGAA